jgi:DNA-binding transcriptional regulator YbjK
VPDSPRRQQLLEAALHVLADEGLRGLTHRAVDRRAGLPEGSCSAYLRTRRALQAALAGYVADLLLADVDRLAADVACASEPDGVAPALDLFQRWLDQRELLVARLELTMAASRDAELAGLLGAQRGRLIELVERIMVATGKEHGTARAETLVASYDGILLAALLKPQHERRSFLERSLDLLGKGMAGVAEG